MDEAKPRSRRGSETRQRQRPLSVRLSELERAELKASASDAGLTVGSYVRSRVLTKPTTRARPKPSIEVTAIAQLLGQVNKVGSNIHQILRRINFGDTPAGEEVRAAFEGYRQVNAEIMTVLRRRPR